MSDVRIMIAGSRSFNNYQLLKDTIDKVLTKLNLTQENIINVNGVAKGADTLGGIYAKEKGYSIERYPAKWKDLNANPCKIKYNKYGPYNCLAGMNRNIDMVKVSDIVFMFHDGMSPGTANDLELCKTYNKKYVYINYNDSTKNDTNLDINL